MQTLMTAQTALHATTENPKLLICENGKSWGHSIDPITLAYLDFGLFKSLCKRGFSRERICSVLDISYADLDYLRKLSMA